MRFPCLLAFVVCFPILVACEDTGPPVAPPEGDAEAALLLLARLDRGAVAEAYARLDRYVHTAEVHLTVREGEAVTTTARTVARRPTADGVEERLVAAESTGALGGAWPERLRLANPLSALLPDEPAFLAPRAWEQYRYSLGPDTTVAGRRLRVVEARLRPEASGEQAVRRVRYFLAPASDAVLGVAVERASASVLFDETDRAVVFLQPGPDGARVPALTVVETTVDVAGAAPRRLRLEGYVRAVRRGGQAP